GGPAYFRLTRVAAAGLRAGAAGVATARWPSGECGPGAGRGGVQLRGAAAQLRGPGAGQDDGELVAGRGGAALGAAAGRGIPLGGVGTAGGSEVILPLAA